MSDSGYTPSMEDIRLGFACYSDNRDMSLYKYDREAGLREWERIRDGAFAQFDRALAAHDAVIRKDQAERDIAIVDQLYPLGSEVLGNAPTVIAAAIRAQSEEATRG